jgi:hypothetical protein
MEKLKKFEAFNRAQAAFGPWSTWRRSQHVAYGLIRGVPYVSMERCSNDAPPWGTIAFALAKLGAWPEVVVPANAQPWQVGIGLSQAHRDEVARLVVWVRKEPRGPRLRVSKGAPTPPAAVAS